MLGPDFVTITPQIIERLCFLREQTGVSYAKLLSGREDVPEGLRADMVANWLFGRSHRAREDHLSYVIRLWEALPRHVFVERPEAEVEAMRVLAHDTRIGPTALLRGRRREMPNGLTAAMLTSWLRDTPDIARQDHIDYALGLWRALVGKAHVRVPITAEHLTELRDLRNRTGVGPTRLLAFGDDQPEGLTPAMITQWLRGGAGTSRKDYLDYVLALWRSVPGKEASADEQAAQRNSSPVPDRPVLPKKSSERSRKPPPRRAERSRPKRSDIVVPVTRDTMRRLTALQESTGVGFNKLLKGRDDLPDGLKPSTVGNWLSRRARTARPDYLECVFGLWEALPRHVYVESPDEEMREMRSLARRSGVGARALLRGRRKEQPEGLTARLLASWLAKTPKRARRDHLDFALSRWRVLIDHGRDRSPVTESYLKRLQRHRERSGVEPAGLFDGANGLPEGLSLGMVRQWLGGNIASARKDHMDYVLARWSAMPDAAPPDPVATEPEQEDVRITLDARHREALRRYRDMRLLPGAVLGGSHDDRPDGLSAAVISGWLSGRTSRAREDHLNWVLTRCATMAVSTGRRVPVTEEHRNALKAEAARTGLGQTDLLRIAGNVPDGLTAGMISQWVSGNVATARKDHLEWVLTRWRALNAG